MARRHSTENGLTLGKKSKNSKIYTAKNGGNDDSIAEKPFENDAYGDLPRRESVTLMRNVYETLSSPHKSARTENTTPNATSGPCHRSSDFGARHNPGKSQPSRENTPSGDVDFDILPNAQPPGHGQNAQDLPDPERQNTRRSSAGSLLVQPASNIRVSLGKVEYLNLNKFNDIRTPLSSSKRPRVNVDELDKKRDDILPATYVDNVVDVASDDVEETECSSEGNVVFEFEGAGVMVNRSVLKTSKSKSKKVSFSDCPQSVFEYPPDPAEPFSGIVSDSDSESHAASDSEQEKVINRCLQSSPGCNGTGVLGLYQPRLLENCAVIANYNGFESLPSQSFVSNSDSVQPTDTTVVKKALLSSCSAEEPSWSNGNSSTELLF